MGGVDGWTIDTLRAHLAGQIVDLRTMLDERYATQTKSLDAAFVAHQAAVRTALDSAEKAVTKAEAAAEKRFESVNEFRGQLADQAGHFINRAETEVRLQAIMDKVNTVEGIVVRAVTQDQYAAAHEALRQSVDTERLSLADHKAWDIKLIGDLGAALTGLKNRYAGASVALGVIMTVLIVLVTVVGLAGK
jgi:hypothetical protein